MSFCEYISCLQPDADTVTLRLQGALIIPLGLLFFQFPVCGTPSGRMTRRRRGIGGCCEGRLPMTQPETSSSALNRETGRHSVRSPLCCCVPPLYGKEPFQATGFHLNVPNAAPPIKRIRTNSEKRRHPSASVTEEGTLQPGRRQQLASRRTVAANRLA